MPTPEQQDLIDRLAGLLESEAGVLALWLAGSLGAGRGDAFSDVDTLALTAEGRAGAVSVAVADRLGEIVRPVLVNRLFGGRILNVVTETWSRFDISFVEPAELDRYDSSTLVPLFNRVGLSPPARVEPPYVTAPDALLKMVEEFLRVLGLLVVAVGREEYQLSLTGMDILRRLTMDLMLEENGVAPWRRGGALRRNPLLTAEQRAALAAIPPQAANRDSVIAANAAFAAVFLPRARRLADRIGMAWPAAFEAATRQSLSRHLGLDI